MFMSLFKRGNKFTIIDHPDLFKDDTYPLSYKLIILHSIWYSYHHHGKEVSTAQVLSDMHKIIDQDNNFIYIKKCLEMYPFWKDKELGLVLIDRSKACYPLIFYPADNLPEHGNRVDALKVVLQDLSRNHEFFDDILKKSDKWNTELVTVLKGKFTNPNPKIGKP